MSKKNFFKYQEVDMEACIPFITLFHFLTHCEDLFRTGFPWSKTSVLLSQIPIQCLLDPLVYWLFAPSPQPLSSDNLFPCCHLDAIICSSWTSQSLVDCLVIRGHFLIRVSRQNFPFSQDRGINLMPNYFYRKPVTLCP